MENHKLIAQWCLAGILLVALSIGCDSGSGEESTCGATENWRSFAGNPVMGYERTAIDGIPGDPSVVYDAGLYVMYYAALRGDFSDPLLRIFRATSTDGVTWNRNHQPVFGPGGPGTWDATNVETPFVLRLPDGTWAMYYSGNAGGSDVGFHIGLATSADGVTWTRFGSDPLLAATEDEVSLIGPSVLYDEQSGSYVMLYGSITNRHTIEIRRARSQDGIAWERAGVVLRMDDVERRGPDDVGVMGPELLKTGRGYEVVYNALIAPAVEGGPPRAGGIYYARSDDGEVWTKGGAIYLPPGGDRFDAVEVGAQAWLERDGGYRLWYVGTNTDYQARFDSGIGLLEWSCPASSSPVVHRP